MAPPEKTILLISAFNEEKNIGYILGQAAILKNTGMISEFVVMDDGSEDGTSEVASKAGATVIRLERNVGKGGAMLRGMLYCRNAGAAIVLLADADTVSGATQKQVACLLGELDACASPRVMMAVYPQKWDMEWPNGKASGCTVDYSGFRALRLEGLNFLFAPDGEGWKISSSRPARRFFRDSHGYGLENALGERFKNRMRLLAAAETQIETLPIGRGEDTRKKRIDLDISNSRIRFSSRDIGSVMIVLREKDPLDPKMRALSRKVSLFSRVAVAR